jgi:hypothetical protein
MLGGHVGIPVLLFLPACSFFHYEADFIQGLLKKNKKKLARSFNFILHYIDDVLSLNKFGDFVDHIYPIELEIKDTTDTARFASYLDLPEHLNSPLFFSGVRVTRSLVLCVCFVDHCLYFFFWPLSCLFFFDILMLITPLVSSNFSMP